MAQRCGTPLIGLEPDRWHQQQFNSKWVKSCDRIPSGSLGCVGCGIRLGDKITDRQQEHCCMAALVFRVAGSMLIVDCRDLTTQLPALPVPVLAERLVD
jgi:hypothetical protein